MSSEAVKLARANRQMAQMAMVERLLYNPAVEFIGGMYAIENLFPDAKSRVITTTTGAGSNQLIPGPFDLLRRWLGDTTTTTEVSSESTEEHWAKNALMWIIIAQQLAPVIPGAIQAAGSGAVGLLKAVK